MEKIVICKKSFNDIQKEVYEFPPIFSYDRGNGEDFCYGGCYTVVKNKIISDNNKVFEWKKIKQFFIF